MYFAMLVLGHSHSFSAFLRSSNRFLTQKTYFSSSVCVGTKNDMSSSRAVKYAEASEYAESEKVPYFECTSKDGNSVDELFRAVGEQLVKKIKDGVLEISE